MSKKSKEKRDKKKKAQLKALRKNSVKQKPIDPIEIQAELDKIFDPLKLTTPSEINDDILNFCRKISLATPFFLDSEPEPWSRQSCCDQNVNEYIKQNDGNIVCGYKIWYNKPNYIEAERHAVWYKDGAYKDVSFNSDGEVRILFVPDIEEKQNNLEDNESRIRWGKDSKTKQLIKYQNDAESFQAVYKMSNEEAWNTMLTYEDWSNGKRMPNIIQKTIS